MGKKITIPTAVLMSFVPPVQLWTRIFEMKGSFDKPWLLLFQLPFLSVIPAVMMSLGYVEDGQGQEPYDWYMNIPPTLYIIGLLFSLVNKSGSHLIGLFLQMILPIIGGFIVFYLRGKTNCNESFNDGLSRNLFNSLFTHGCAILSTKLIHYIPFIGQIFEKLNTIKYLGALVDGGIYYCMYLTIYVIINMMNGYDIKKYCANGDDFLNIIRAVGAIAGGFGIFFGLFKDHSSFCSIDGNYCSSKPNK